MIMQKKTKKHTIADMTDLSHMTNFILGHWDLFDYNW